MVRRRGRPRRSFAYLRIRRYRLKYMHQILPIRFKLLLPPMHQTIETVLTQYDYLETLLFPKFEDLGIPEDQYPNYLAWAKRKAELMTRLSAETLWQEIALLTEEFIQRGLDKDILAQLEPIIEDWNIMRRLPLWHVESWSYPEPPAFTLQYYETWTYGE